MTGQGDILLNQGATFSATIYIKDANGDGVDLTGHTFEGDIREDYATTSSVAAFTFTLMDQSAFPGGVTVTIPASDTATIPVDTPTGTKRTTTKYVYDIKSTDADDIVYRWLEGVVEVSPEVTR
jgi:hypothetical protein